MLLFRPEHVNLILHGTKTQTRRIWKRRRVREGSAHLCYTRPPFARPAGKPFARVYIEHVRTEPLLDISEHDARAEGYENVGAYLEAFARINRIGPGDLAGLSVYVVQFYPLERL